MTDAGEDTNNDDSALDVEEEPVAPIGPTPPPEALQFLPPVDGAVEPATMMAMMMTSDNDDHCDGNNAMVVADPSGPPPSSRRRGISSASHSLAKAPTTPTWAVGVIPLVALATHILFIYGQLAPMWKLSLTAEDIEVWANATTTQSHIAFDTMGLPHEYHYILDNNHTIQTFTYGFAVQELWNAQGMPGSVLPRVAALLLVIFSGFWPHIKLLWLQRTWFTSHVTSTKRRTATLQWLALLGKWSLADVFTVCVMVGVLHLDWIVDPPLIKQGIMDNLHTVVSLVQDVFTVEELCNKFLELDCTSDSLTWHEMAKCKACLTFVQEAYYHPEMVEKTGKSIVSGVQMSGGGEVQLSVVGMEGIYAFCAAVFISILLSLVVDVFNYRYNRYIKLVQRMGGANELGLDDHGDDLEGHGGSTVPTDPLSSDADSEASEPLLADRHASPTVEPLDIDEGSVYSRLVERTRINNPVMQKLVSACNTCVWPMITIVLVYCADYMPSMERKVDGAIPIIVQDILGIHWEKEYSLQTLMETTGYAKGWDYLLMATFGIFCVIGPLVRAVLMVFVTLVQGRKSLDDNDDHHHEEPSTRMVVMTILLQFLAAFCAWEVFVIGMFMVELLMPSITDTIVQTAACASISENGSCLQVAFERQDAFWTIIIGGILLWACSNHAVGQHHEHEERYHRSATNPNAALQYVILQDQEQAEQAQQDSEQQLQQFTQRPCSEAPAGTAPSEVV